MRILVAQSGGPTAVINASLVGAVKRARELGHEIFGGIYGIEGVLKDKVIPLLQSELELEKISHTPGAFLGSCRFVLPEFGAEEYDVLFKVFEARKIDAFLYIGGNDSMDSVAKIYLEAQRRHFPMLVIGIPKTIDNDLVETDHCPGFASAAKFLNIVASEFVIDSIAYSKPSISVVETMGRDTGWLAASLKLSERLVKGLKTLIYLPEKPTSDEEILSDVQIFKDGPLLVVVSEGTVDEKGNYLKSTPVLDSFGHPKLGGVGEHVASLLEKIGKVKLVNPGFVQRAASHIVSSVDFQEAQMVASFAVDSVDDGKSGFFVAIDREKKDYLSTAKLVPISKVANKVKKVPQELLDNDMRGFVEYLEPLVDGLPDFLVR